MPASAAVSTDTVHKLLQDVPIFFEPNQGQWNPRVKFSAHAGNYRLFLTGREALLSYYRPGEAAPRLAGVSFLNANPSPEAAGADPLASRSNYFRGRTKAGWRAGVPHYARVMYREVYPGIDVVYYGNRKRLEYDFVLAPGADPRRIRMKFSGGRLSLTAGGDLVLEDGETRLLQHRPYVYQEDPQSSSRREVSGRYKLLGRNVVGVEVDEYDRSRPLTIDPILVFSSFLGGAGSDAVTAVKVNSEGMVYAIGYTNSADITGTDGAYKPDPAGRQDVFLAKINPAAAGAAALVSFTFFGGSGMDTPAGLALVSKDIVYFAGTTDSTDLPLAICYQRHLAGGTDAFIVKLDYSFEGTDALFYSTYLGGGDSDYAVGIGADAQGMAYVIGTTRSDNFPLTDSAYQKVKWGPQDLFIAKLNPDNESSSLIYSTYLGGELTDYAEAIAVRPDGMVYFAAATDSTLFPWAGYSYSHESFGGVDAVVGQMDLTKSGEGSLVYTMYFGGSGFDEPRAIALDPSGKVLVAGYTLSTDLPTTPGAYQHELRGNADVFVARLDLTAPPEGVLSYVTYLGGGGGDVAYGLASDRDGNAYVTGYTLSADFPVTGDAWQPGWGWGVDVFVAKLDASGALAYSTYLGQTGINAGYGIAAAEGGSIYVGGITARKGVPATSNAFQGAYGGGVSDGFVVVFAP
jgi:hypothetical protein